MASRTSNTVSDYEANLSGESAVFLRIVSCNPLEYELFTGYSPMP